MPGNRISPVSDISTGGNKWSVLAITTGAQISTAFISLGISSLIPFLVKGLKMTATDVGMAGGAVNVGMTLTALLAGRLADRYGEKIVLVVGCLFTGLSIILSSLSGSFPVFYLLLLFTGFWAAAITPAGSKAINGWFSKARQGFAQSVRQTGVTLGGLIGALILPRLAMAANWHVSLACAGMAGVLGALSVQLFYHERPASGGGAVDAADSASIWQQLNDRNIWLTCIMAMVFVGGQFILLSYLELYLQFKAGFSIREASVFLSLMILAGMLGRIFWGGVSDSLFHRARRPVIMVIGVIAAVMSLGMPFVDRFTPLWLMGCLTFMLGFTALGWNGVYIALLSEQAKNESSAATVVGIGISSMQIGVLFMPPLFGYLIDITHNYQASWFFLSVLMLAGVVLTGVVREKNRQGRMDGKTL